MRYYRKSSKVYRSTGLALEILKKIVKSLSQYRSCAQDIAENRQKSIAVQVLRMRYYRNSSKVYRSTGLAHEILQKIVKSLSQYRSCARDIAENRKKSIASPLLRLRYSKKSLKVYRKPVPERSFKKLSTENFYLICYTLNG